MKLMPPTRFGYPTFPNGQPGPEAPAARSGQAARASVSHIPSLDGFRAVSIAIVFMAHADVSDHIPGGFGVTVFFFLSGFLITTLLTREQDRHSDVSLTAFYLRRIVRLLPPLVITLAAATALALAGMAEGDLSAPAYVSQILFFYNYHSLASQEDSTVTGLEVLWSLSVEEHFYLIWPILFIAIARRWIGIRAILVMLVAILVWRYVRFAMMGGREWAIYISTDTRFDSLLYGCLLALLNWRGHASGLFPEALADRVALIVGALALLMVTFVVRDEAFRSTFRYTLQGLALMPLFYYAVLRPGDLPFRPLNWAPVRMVGIWSYTIYLCHFVIIEALVHSGIGEPGEAHLIALAAALSCVYAALVYHLAERPLKPLRARLVGH